MVFQVSLNLIYQVYHIVLVVCNSKLCYPPHNIFFVYMRRAEGGIPACAGYTTVNRERAIPAHIRKASQKSP